VQNDLIEGDPADDLTGQIDTAYLRHAFPRGRICPCLRERGQVLRDVDAPIGAQPGTVGGRRRGRHRTEVLGRRVLERLR
jgi:hypothetical protein